MINNIYKKFESVVPMFFCQSGNPCLLLPLFFTHTDFCGKLHVSYNTVATVKDYRI